MPCPEIVVLGFVELPQIFAHPDVSYIDHLTEAKLLEVNLSRYRVWVLLEMPEPLDPSASGFTQISIGPSVLTRSP